MNLHLSPRQIEVYLLAASGLTDKGISRELEITVDTVRFHLNGAATQIHHATGIDGTPREIIRDFYRECRRRAFFARAAA